MQLNKQHPLYQEDLSNILSVKGIETLRGKSILITGATGLIGVHMIDALIKLGDVKIYAVGRSKERAAERLGEYYDNSNFIFIENDVCQPFSQDLHIDYIIPGASHTHPLAYSQFPIETIMINVKGVEHALELAARTNAVVLYPSTVEVYGNARGNDAFTEDYTGQLNLSNSRSCYTESKRVCEALCQSYIAERGLDVKIVRLSRIFGPTMLESDTKASSQFIKKALAGEDIVLKSKGEQHFSYTYVTDAVAAMLHIMINGETGKAYNISNDKCNVHLKDFACYCAYWASRDVIFDLPSEFELKGYSIASKAIMINENLLKSGFAPRYDIKQSIVRTLEILKGC
jgi:nucleoside-diphosphate-sugar epimerase